MHTTKLHARWVVPVNQPPIESGYVLIRDDRSAIASAHRPDEPGPVVDLGDAMLLPAFANAHTHLALTSLRGQIPFEGSFVGWIKRLQSAYPLLNDDEAFRSSMQAGLQESLSAGVSHIADIGYGQRSVHAWQGAAIQIMGFLEVLGMGPRRGGDHPRSIEAAQNVIRSAFKTTPRLSLGLSPHAPYSTDPSIYRQAIRAGVRLCTHLAETKDELQFLRSGAGPFREILEEWNLWDGSFQPPACSPVAYMRQLGVLSPQSEPSRAPLLAHVNYVDDADLAILAESHAHVVYCPRTHAFFRHEPHRYREMLARGINVCLGTDSLASNDSLSILDELRFLRSIDRISTNDELLAMATLRGTRALRRTTSPDAGADWIAIRLENPSTRDPLEDLLASQSTQVSYVFIDGRQINV